MNENNETMAVLDADIDNEWGGVEGTPETPAEPETAPEGKDTAKPENEPPVAENQGQAGQDQPETFTLKRMGETRQVSRDDLIAMAQKGWDYDTVREERDQLRQYRQEADPALELVKTYAKQNNMSVGDYLDFCRKQEFMRQGMTEQDAVTRVGMEKERAALDARQAELQKAEQAQTSAAAAEQKRQEALRADIANFCRVYPGVDPKNIPNEVWAAVKNGDTLTNAYTMHENKRLQAELAAERQNKDNQKKTPGSLGGNVGAELDEIDRLWGEDD